jgi:hypothetical protein
VTSLGLAILVALVSSLALPRALPELGWRLAVCCGAALGLLVVGLGVLIDGLLATGGLRSRIVRELFIGELLGLVPDLPRDPTPVATRNIRWPHVGGVAPRATLMVSLLLASMALLAAVVPHTNAAQGSLAVANPEVPASAPPVAEPAPPPAPFVRIVGPCECPRDQGPLGNEPMPRVSLLTVSSRSFQRSGRSYFELELAAVNNGSRDISDLSTVVEFSQDDKQPWSKPVNVSVRALFHKTLVSGAAIKWRVDAEGETARMRAPMSRGALIEGSVQHDGEGAAPTSAIAELLEARSTPVRLHGAMLLAYLDDAHAKESLSRLLESVGDAEKVYLSRLIEAIGALRTCHVQVSGEGPRRRASSCISNVTDERITPIDVTFRALDKSASMRAPQEPAPEILTEWSFGVPGSIEAKQGIEVQADVDFAAVSKPAGAFEAYARKVSARP